MQFGHLEWKEGIYRRMSKRSFLLSSLQLKKRHGLVLLAGLGLILAGAGASSTARSKADLLNGSAFLEHVRFLASDDLGGRGNGSRELEEAAQYVADRFRALGLRPAGDDGSYFQPFTVTLGGTLGANNTLSLEGVEIGAPLEIHRDFEPMTFTGAGTVEAPVVFVGYSITAPEHHYDDYRDIDVTGKVVLMLRRIPRNGRDDSPFEAERGHATFVTKVVNAKAHQAAAVLLVNLDQPDELVKFGQDLGAEDLSIPAIHIKRKVAERLFQKAGKDLAAVQEKIDEDLSPSSFELAGVKARIHLDINRARAQVRNILGYLPPANARGDEEILVIGAHYDHVGRGYRHSRASQDTRGQIHNGADDNASGTAAMLELARVFTTRNDLGRGILFAAFAGEELGLLGSSHYTRSPTLPLENTVAMFNLDMVGRLRNDKLYIGGVGTSPGFRPVLGELGKAENLTLSFSFSGYGSSDHTSFTLQEIPSLFFFTGLHEDYHRPSDDWDEINAAGAERVMRLVYQMVDHIQALPERPEFDKSAPIERRPAGGGRGYGAWFGSVPDFGYEGTGVAFSGIREGSPAAKAGFKSGDVLIEFDGMKIDNLYDFTDALRRHKPGDEVAVKVLRDEKTLEAKVTLGRRP